MTVAQIEAIGGMARVVSVDVCSAESARQMVRITETELGPVDVLVNNAGWDRITPFLETDEVLWEKLLAINTNYS